MADHHRLMLDELRQELMAMLREGGKREGNHFTPGLEGPLLVGRYGWGGVQALDEVVEPVELAVHVFA